MLIFVEILLGLQQFSVLHLGLIDKNNDFTRFLVIIFKHSMGS
jgi:hypothetical protein